MLGLLRFLIRRTYSPRDLLMRAVALIVMAIVISVLLLRDRDSTPMRSPTDFLPIPSALNDAGTIAIGQTVHGSIGADERDAWQFEGESGQVVNIRVYGAWDSTLELIPPNGEAATAVDFDSGGQYQPFICAETLRESGQYSIVVSGYLALPDRNTGDYQLRLEAETLKPTVTVSGSASLTGEVNTCDGDHYALAASAGDTLDVTLLPEQDAPLFLRLIPARDSDDLIAFGEAVTLGDGRVARRIRVTLSENGEVVLRVSAPPDSPDIRYRMEVEITR